MMMQTSESRELWGRYNNSPNREHRDALVDYYAPIVQGVVAWNLKRAPRKSIYQLQKVVTRPDNLIAAAGRRMFVPFVPPGESLRSRTPVSASILMVK